jgi:hypothetical protein
MDFTHTITDEVRNKQLIWYEHAQRMADHRIPKQILNCQPRGRRKSGRPRRSWRDGIDKELRKRVLEDNLWNDRERWSLEIGKRRRAL